MALDRLLYALWRKSSSALCARAQSCHHGKIEPRIPRWTVVCGAVSEEPEWRGLEGAVRPAVFRSAGSRFAGSRKLLPGQSAAVRQAHRANCPNVLSWHRLLAFRSGPWGQCKNGGEQDARSPAWGPS